MGKPNENGESISLKRQAQTIQSAPVMQDEMKQTQAQPSYQEYEKEQQMMQQSQIAGQKEYLAIDSVNIATQETRDKIMRKAIKNRGLDELLSQEVSSTDSVEMSAVKLNVQKCNELLNTEIKITEDKDATLEQLTRLEQAYFDAVTACRYYCDHKNPRFRTGRQRKSAVAGAYEILKEEMSYISYLKEQALLGTLKTDKENVVGADLIEDAFHATEAHKEKKEPSDPILSMTYQDFTKLITKEPKDGLIFRAGSLRIVKGGILDKKSEVASGDNKKLVEHLIDVSVKEIEKAQKWNGAERGAQAADMKLRLYQALGVDAFAEKSGMLSMANFAKVMDMIGHLKSDVDYAMQEHAQVSDVERALAKVVDHALPASGKTAMKPKEAVQKLRSVLKNAEKSGMKLPEISDDELNDFAAQNFYELRDQVYHRLISFGQSVKVLSYGDKLDIDRLAGDEKLMNNLMALQIARMSSVSPVGAMAAEYQIQSLMETAAFDYYDDLELVAAYAGTNVSQLADGGSDELRELAMSKLATHKNWEENSKSSLRGINNLSEVCDLLSKLQEFKRLAVQEGIPASQKGVISLYKNTASRLQQLVDNKELMKDMAYVAGELEGTRFAEGFKELLKVTKKKNVFVDSTNRLLADADKRASVHEEEYAFRNETKQRLGIDETADKVNLTGIQDLLKKFDGSAKDVIAVLVQSKNPSELIKKAGDDNAEDIARLYQALHSLALGNAFADTYFNDVRLTLTVRDDGDLTVKVDGHSVTLPYKAEYITYSLQRDMSKNADKYGEKIVSGVFKEVFEKSYNGDADGDEARDLYTNIIEKKTGVSATEFAHFSTTNLATLADACLRGEVDKDLMTSLAQSEAMAQIKDSTHNEMEILEIMQSLESAKKYKLKEQESVVFKEKKAEANVVENQWKQDEAEVLQLLSGLFSRDDTWREDLAQLPPAARLKKYLYENADKLVKVIQSDELLDRTMSKFKIPGADDTVDELKDQIRSLPMADQLKALSPEMATKILKAALSDGNEAEELLSDEFLDEMVEQAAKSGKFEKLSAVIENEENIKKAIEEAEKNGESTFLLNVKWNAAYIAVAAAKGYAKTQVKEAIEEVINQKKEGMIDKLCEDLDNQLMDQTNSVVDMVQDELKEGVSNLFGDSQIEKLISEMTLSEIVEKNFTGGEEGQGKFLRLVLEGYFKNASDMDKRAMVASAIRFAKPAPAGALTDDQKKKQLGAFFGGFLKGAGPLMHKLLQGLPTTNMDEQLKKAIADTKSNLAPIPKDIVNARMEQLVRRSHKMISKIEIERSLGAASIGQAFLCRIYGPNYDKDGQEVVVKLLRPDARNHLEREKKFMLDCADKTDAGMRRTYEMTLENIERELDLRIEASNVRKGQIYNDEAHKVASMKLVDVVEADTGAMMVEKAEGDTVDKYIEKQRAELSKLRLKIESRNLSDNGMSVIHELVKLREGLRIRQNHVAELAKKWFEEGVYEGGFFHGDLHAGNIIVNEDRATAIDFGNATKVEKYQQTHVLHLVAASGCGNVAGFLAHFKPLLSDASKALYEEKKDEFELVLRQLMGKNGDPGLRISAIMSEAQKLGLEVPRALQSFSNCEIRLANTLEDMNTLYDDMGEALSTAFSEGMGNDTLDPIAQIKYQIGTNAKKRDNKEKAEPIDTLVRRELNKTEDKTQYYEDSLRKGNEPSNMGALTALHDLPGRLDMSIGILQEETTRTLPAEAWKYALSENLKFIESDLTELKLSKGQIDIYMKPVKAELEKSAPDIDVVIAKFREVKNSHLTEEIDNYLQKLEHYNGMRNDDKVSAADKDAVLKEIMDMGSRFYNIKGYSLLDNAANALISDNENRYKMDVAMKTMLDDADLVARHPELKDTYRKIRERQDSGETVGADDPLLVQFKAALEAACLTRAQDIEGAVASMKKGSLRSFFDVSGEVIEKRLVETCFMKLGAVGILRYLVFDGWGRRSNEGVLRQKDAYARKILLADVRTEKSPFMELMKKVRDSVSVIIYPDMNVEVKEGEKLTEDQSRAVYKKNYINEMKVLMNTGLPQDMPNRQRLLAEMEAYEQDRKGEHIYNIAQDLQSFFRKIMGDIMAEDEDDDIFTYIDYSTNRIHLDAIANNALRPDQRIVQGA